MESVGQKLREARLRIGLSLDDISSSTRISSRILAAIEADELSGFARFHYRSFARQFASAVNLDFGLLNNSLEAALDRMPEPLYPGQLGTPVRPDVASMKTQRVRVTRWIHSVTLLVTMLVACSTFYSIWQNLRTTAAPPTANAPSSANSSRIPSVAAVAERAKPAPAATKDGEFHIQLSAIERTWLSVVSDGREVYSGTLNADETKMLEGRETARIRTGNAGGVEVTFNGKMIGPLGSEGQVRTVLFTKNGYEILESQAASVELLARRPDGAWSRVQARNRQAFARALTGDHLETTQAGGE